jgi:hypothetical protein
MNKEHKPHTPIQRLNYVRAAKQLELVRTKGLLVYLSKHLKGTPEELAILEDATVKYVAVLDKMLVRLNSKYQADKLALLASKPLVN